MLRETLTNAQKEAMKAKDTARLSTVRLILAKMIKQRDESAKIYDEGGRPELATKEREEIAIIQGYMPVQLSDDKVREICAAVVAEIGAQGVKDMGKCMTILRERYAGQMDFAKASAALKDLLK
jgi:uncharacterized protein YqeY